MVIPLGDVNRKGVVAYATLVIIALNVFAFIGEAVLGPRFATSYAATPWEITHGIDLPVPLVLTDDGPRAVQGELNAAELRGNRVIPQGPVPFPVSLTILTGLFLHGSTLHLFGNMLFLWIFGDNVEDVLGPVRFVVVYLLCGVVGSLTQILASPDSVVPTLGASGAVAGIMGVYLVWFPMNRVRLLWFRGALEVPAVWVLGLWIGVQFLRGAVALETVGATGGTAYLSHVGGATTGLIVGFLFRDRARRMRARAEADQPA